MELEIELDLDAIFAKAWAQYVEASKKEACDIHFDDPTDENAQAIKVIFATGVQMGARLAATNYQSFFDDLLKGRKIVPDEDAEDKEESEDE